MTGSALFLFMANEITVTATLQLNNAVTTMSAGASGLARTQAGSNKSAGTLVLTTTPGAAVPKGGITNIGYAFFKNLDASITITITAGSGGNAVAILKPGDVCLLCGVLAPWAFAASGTPQLEYDLIEA